MLTETGNSSKHEILIRRRSKKLSKFFRPSTSYPRPSTIYPRLFTLDPRPVTLDPRAFSSRVEARFKRIFRNSPLPRLWYKHGYFILSWKRVNLQQSAVLWWKSKRIFSAGLKLYWSQRLSEDGWCWTNFMAAKLKVSFFVLLRVALLILQLTLSA